MTTSQPGNLPPQVLQWLHRVVAPEYQDPRRTYTDVATALAAIPTLSPRTSVYTYENGKSELLVRIQGTLPAMFRGSTFNVPLSFWIPHQYPAAPPIAFVAPSQDVAIRSGNHVDPSGKCYHPYLSNWVNNSERSNILDLCEVLRGVFAREPPIVSKQASPQEPSEAPTPPPLPPLPPELEHTSPPEPQPKPQVPPPLPPLPHELGRPGPIGHSVSPPQHPSQRPPPPLPPHPSTQQALPTPTPVTAPARAPPRPGPAPPPLPPAPHRSRHAQSSGSPVSPEQPLPPPRPVSTQISPRPQGPEQFQPPSVPQRPSSVYSGVPPSYRPHAQPPQPQEARPPYPEEVSSSQYTPIPAASPRPKPKPVVDLLDSVPSTEIPVKSPETPPPPPPNPEKDRLIHQISLELHKHAEGIHAKTATAIASAASQNQSMLRTEAAMERERAELQHISDLCDKDAEILRERIAMAERVVDEAKRAETPGVDEMIVAPSVLHSQLYDLVTEDMAIEETMYVLSKALDRERVELDVFMKQIRSLAREQFLKRALARKIAEQLGLDV